VAVRVEMDGGGVKARSAGGRLLRSLFFAAFCAFGLWFSSLVVRGFVHSARVYGWTATRCVVEASAVEEHPEAQAADEAYVFRVRYHYAVGGRSFVGVRYRSDYSGSSDVGATQRLTIRYPAGAEVPCYVDPRRPGEATLVRPSLWGGLIILFPLIFVAAGAGGIYWQWRPSGRRAAAAGTPSAALSERAAGLRPGAGAALLSGFFGLFLAAGLGVGIPFFALPAWRTVQARSWIETPCTILHSAVRAHSDSDSTTYDVEVLYAYRIAGRDYKSSRYHFLGGSSSGRAAKDAAVARYPEDSRAVCYVNPADPTDAVLVRELTAEYWIGLVPLVFVVVGGGGVVFTLRGYFKARTRGTNAPPDWLPDERTEAAAAITGSGAAALAAGGPTTLRAGTGPGGKLVAVTFAALFWNGIVSVFLWHVVEGYRQGQGDGCLTAFLVPFVLVGLVLLISVPYQVLATFNPRPVLTLADGTLHVGDTTTLTWGFHGRAGRIHHLRIFVEGREEATYRRGTSTSTDRETFATLPVADTADPTAIASGSAPLAIPADTMHSFTASHNKIVWSLKIAGEIRRWPDVAEDFPLVVHPRPLAGGKGSS
jgi:Protein of unknown function (DUF3592)